MKNVLMTGEGYTSEHFSLLSKAGYRCRHLPGDPTQAELFKALSQTEVHILGGSERFSAAEFSVAKHLKLISFVGTGFGTFIDVDLANTHHVKVVNTPAVMVPAVAEHTMGMLLTLRRGIHAQNRAIKESRQPTVESNELSSAQIGFIGLGQIGERVARILKVSFAPKLSYYSRTRKTHLEKELQLAYLNLDDLFKKNEIIILLIPTNNETKGIVNEKRLALMPHTGMIINTAGAALVNPHALYSALEKNLLKAAAFDGYYIEPLPSVAQDPYGLLELPDSRFIVTPHSAAKTPQSWKRMVDHAVNNVINCSTI